MSELIARIVAEIVFKICVAVIEEIGSSSYANDVLDALHARWKRRGHWSAIWSALRAIPAAIDSRVQVMPDTLGAVAVALFAPFFDGAPVLLFFVSFYFYYNFIAGSVLRYLAGNAYLADRPESTLLLVVLQIAAVLVSWRRTRLWSMMAIASLLLASLFNPTSAGIHRLEFAIVPYAGIILAATQISTVTLAVFWFIRGVAKWLGERDLETLRSLIGLVCFVLAAGRIATFAVSAATLSGIQIGLAIATTFLLPLSLAFVVAVALLILEEEWALQRRPPTTGLSQGVFVESYPLRLDETYLRRTKALEARRSAVVAKYREAEGTRGNVRPMSRYL